MAGRKITSKATAVVTGAGSGIGRALALELVRRGGSVVCADLKPEAAEETVAEITRAGGKAWAIKCDVSKLEDVEKLAQQAEVWLGSNPQIVINNAGVGLGGQRVEDTSMEDWQWIMGVNLWGPINGCRVFAPRLRARGRGAILNVSSAASFGAAPMMGAYNVTKAGVLSLSETLRAELAGSGVSVSVLCPTFVKTNIIRNGRMAGNQTRQAQKLMDRSGMSPQSVAVVTLDAMDRGQIHILPQRDARVSWRLKRLAPGLFTRAMGLATRAMPAARE